MNDSALIDRFLEMMAAERGASRNTLAAYRRDLAQAARLAQGRLAEADTTVLRAIMAASRSLAAARAARKFSAFRHYFTLSIDAGGRRAIPGPRIRRPDHRRPPPATPAPPP